MDSNSDMGEEKTDSNTRVEDEARFPCPLWLSRLENQKKLENPLF